MTEADIDKRVAEVLTGLLQVRRVVDGETYVDLLGAVMVEIEQGFEVAMENAHRRRSSGNVIPFQSTKAEDGSK